MKDYLSGLSREELEALALRLVQQGPEGRKVDFKRLLTIGTSSERAEFARDVSSIANSDDEPHLDDSGFIVVGAERGQVVGGIADFAHDKIDAHQAHLSNILKEFLAPVPGFIVVGFLDAAKGPWGVIVVPPSATQPHIFIRDGNGIAKHEWWVRVNDTKERASALDYARVMGKVVSRATRPIERELQRLTLQVEALERAPGFTDLRGLLAATRGAREPEAEARPQQGLASLVRGHLVTGVTAVEERLVVEALRVAEVMAENTDENPWVVQPLTADATLPVLEYLEERTRPLAETLATIARYDARGSMTGAVVRALRVMAREPVPVGTHLRFLAQLRLYPLALCLYSLTAVAVQERRADLLRAVLGLSLIVGQGDRAEPVAVALRRVRSASDFFKVALKKEYFEPVAERVKTVVPAWVTALLAGAASADAFYQAEFVLGLAYMRASHTDRGKTFPLPGTYYYYSEAVRSIETFLKQRPEWLTLALGEPIEQLLGQFDESAKSVVDRHSGFTDGFIGGAADAYSGKSRS